MHWVASNYSLREPSPKATEEPDHSLLRIDGSQEEQRVVSPAPPPKPTSRAPVLGRSPRMLTATTYASPSSRLVSVSPRDPGAEFGALGIGSG